MEITFFLQWLYLDNFHLAFEYLILRIFYISAQFMLHVWLCFSCAYFVNFFQKGGVSILLFLTLDRFDCFVAVCAGIILCACDWGFIVLVFIFL